MQALSKEVLNLFNHILENNKFESEIKNLIIFKKALFKSNFANETEMLNSIKPLINSETVWKPHALLLIGDYFAHKNEYLKAGSVLLNDVTGGLKEFPE